jgi:hypothetical protein
MICHHKLRLWLAALGLWLLFSPQRCLCVFLLTHEAILDSTGAPRLREDVVEVNRFWLPGHVRSVTSSFLLGPTELDIVFSNYQVDTDAASASLR